MAARQGDASALSEGIFMVSACVSHLKREMPFPALFVFVYKASEKQGFCNADS